jgi:hypothetical protein
MKKEVIKRLFLTLIVCDFKEKIIKILYLRVLSMLFGRIVFIMDYIKDEMML